MSVRFPHHTCGGIRATRRGYQRALGASQSTGRGLVRASRAVSRVPSGVMRERYVLTDQIGAGGMGTVWRAWDRARAAVGGRQAGRPGTTPRPWPASCASRPCGCVIATSSRPLDTMPGGSGDGPRARWQRRAAARRPRSAPRLLCPGAPRADARRPGRRARRRSRAPRRQARQPAARADRYGPSVGPAGRLRRRRPHQRTATDGRRWRRHLRLPGTRASRRRTTRPASGPLRRRGGRHRAADRRAPGPASTRRAAGPAPGRADRDRSRATAGHRGTGAATSCAASGSRRAHPGRTSPVRPTWWTCTPTRDGPPAAGGGGCRRTRWPCRASSPPLAWREGSPRGWC